MKRSRLSGERMDSGHDKPRRNAEGDRLSSLPDDLIHKILSFISIKYAIETSVLSSRWRFIWTLMPYLNFLSQDFLSLPKFSKFVTHVLSCRNNQIDVSSVKLNFRGKSSQVFVKRILNYAFSHNVQQLTVKHLLREQIEFPLSLFSSQSLKYLHLTGLADSYSIKLTSSGWELPALTTLRLDYVTLYDENTDKCIGIFSKCANLKNLSLNHCRTMTLDGLSICHPRLSNLTLENGYRSSLMIVNVVAPQLANLTIRNWSIEPLISAPDGFCSLEKVDLCIDCPYGTGARKLLGLLQQLHSVKFLTLNLEIIELLSSSLELISHRPSPFANLKSLKIYPVNEFSEAHKKVPMSTEVKNYLLDSSPSAAFTMVSREDIRAVRNTTLARNLMAELQVLLEQWKENSETNMAHGKAPIESHKAKMQVQHEQGKAQVENQRKMQLHIGGRMTQIESYWKDLSGQIEQGKAKTCDIISKLRQIEGLLTKLPTSQRAKIQARFSSLCAEANIVMNNIIKCTKIKCDKKRKYLLS